MSINREKFLAFGLSFSIDYGTAKGLGRRDVDIPLDWLPSLRCAEYAFTILYVASPVPLPCQPSLTLL